MREVLTYNEETGIFTWKQPLNNRTKEGGIAGSNTSSNGYWNIKIDGNKYLAHRLVWLYLFDHFPNLEIDHINHDRTDNRLSNLREVTHVDNCLNQKLRKDNRSGVTGVHWNRHRQKWRVTAKNKHLGEFDDFHEACQVRKQAEVDQGFHQNHGGH